MPLPNADKRKIHCRLGCGSAPPYELLHGDTYSQASHYQSISPSACLCLRRTLMLAARPAAILPSIRSTHGIDATRCHHTDLLRAARLQPNARSILRQPAPRISCCRFIGNSFAAPTIHKSGTCSNTCGDDRKPSRNETRKRRPYPTTRPSTNGITLYALV